jgi:hypothetical protein
MPSAADIVWWKPFAAAAAGRALLLLEAKRSEPITSQKILGVLLYEPCIIAGFAFLAWHAFSGVQSEDIRLTATVLLAWTGQRGLEMLLSRFLPARPPGASAP